MERPDPETAERLLRSQSLRAARLAARLAEIPDPKLPLRGRKFPELPCFELIEGQEIVPLPQGVVKALARRVSSGRRPLINKFTRHYMFDNPTPDNLYQYVEAAKRRNKTWSQDPEEQAGMIEDRRRQPRNVEDKIQRGSFDDRNIALWRLAAVTAVQRASASGLEVDEYAVATTANAVRDYGFCLMEPNTSKQLESFRFFPTQPKSGGPELSGAMIGMHIAVLGQVAEEDHRILTSNSALLEIMAIEQSNRVQYWGDIFAASIEAFGDRLTDHEHLTMDQTNQDVAYFNALAQAA